MRETWVWSLGREDPLEKEMAPRSSTVAWKIPWTEDPGRLQSMGSQRVEHNWAISLHFTGDEYNCLQHRIKNFWRQQCTHPQLWSQQCSVLLSIRYYLPYPAERGTNSQQQSQYQAASPKAVPVIKGRAGRGRRLERLANIISFMIFIYSLMIITFNH